MNWTPDPPYFVFRSSVGHRGTVEWDSVSRPEIETLLAKLDPWLDRHRDRLVHEDDDPDASEALGAKINATMQALGGDAEQGSLP